MARWTVGDGDAEMVIETTGAGQVSVDIPSHQPIVADPGVVEDMRIKLGAAIGVARGDQSDSTA